MPEKANELVDLRIDFVSLVRAGANRREFLLKSADEVVVEVRAEIRKVDAARRWVTGVLYPLGEVDTQGDFTREATMDAAMVGFMAKGKTAAGRACDVDHDGQATADCIVECYKIEPGDTRWPDPKDAGAWVVTRLVVDDELWAAVERGDYRAFSFGGVAKRVADQPVAKDGAPAVAVTPTLPPFRDLVLRGVFADTLAAMRTPHLIDTTINALWMAFYSGESTEDEKALLQGVLDDARAEFAKEAEPPAEPDPPVALSRLDRLRALLGRGPAAEKAAADTRLAEAEARATRAETALADHLAAAETTAAEKAEADAAREAEEDTLLAEALDKADRLEGEVIAAKAEAEEATTRAVKAEAELEKVMTASPGTKTIDINTPPEPEGVRAVGGAFAS